MTARAGQVEAGDLGQLGLQRLEGGLAGVDGGAAGSRRSGG